VVAVSYRALLRRNRTKPLSLRSGPVIGDIPLKQKINCVKDKESLTTEAERQKTESEACTILKFIISLRQGYARQVAGRFG
jgi:hypothetical protein